MTTPLEQFAAAVRQPEESLQLDVASLLIGAISGDPLTDLAKYQNELDRFAVLAIRKLEPGPFAAARAISQVLFKELGFRGNTSDYYNPNNSFLHSVLDTKLGIPITLSLLYMEVARRLKLTARGVGFPGHFLVRVESGDEIRFIDPFNGGVELEREGLNDLLAQRNGAGAQVERAMLEPIGKHAILRRMLFNLSGIYGQRNDWHRSLAVLERLALLDPENARIEKELAALRARVRSLN